MVIVSYSFFIYKCDFLFVRYGGRHTVTMIPGDGIGPEMMNYVKEVFTHAGVPVDFEMINFDPNSQDTEDLRQVRYAALAFPVLKNKEK